MDRVKIINVAMGYDFDFTDFSGENHFNNGKLEAYVITIENLHKVISLYINKEIDFIDFINWVNFIWFSEYYDFPDSKEGDLILDILYYLEQLDEIDDLIERQKIVSEQLMKINKFIDQRN